MKTGGEHHRPQAEVGTERTHLESKAKVPHLESEGEIDGDPHLESEGEIDNPNLESEGEIDNPHLESEGEIDNPHLESEGEIDNPHLESEGEIDTWSQIFLTWSMRHSTTRGRTESLHLSQES